MSDIDALLAKAEAFPKLLHDYGASALVKSLAAKLREAQQVNADLLALVERAARDSCVTSSDGPGCFYCDHEEHTADCPARAAIARAKEQDDG